MVKKFISCCGEAYGFAYQACEQAFGDWTPLPRLEIERALGELFARHAGKAVVPIENTTSGYYGDTYDYLLSFDAEITGEVWTDIHHCLAVPEEQLRDLVQSGFPGAAGFRGAEGRQLSEDDQRAYRARVDGLFVQRHSEAQCKRSLENLGVEHKLINDDRDPAKEVLREARLGLDAQRLTKTSETSDGHMEMQSTSRAKQKPLYGVVLPLDVARKSDDYVIIQDRIDDDPENATRFYVVEQKPKPDAKNGEAPKGRLADHHKKRIKDLLETPEFVAARMIVKVDTRGDSKTPDVGDVTRMLRLSNIPFTPVYLHKKPHELPVILEIEWTEERINKGPAIAILNLIFDAKHHRNAQLLGLYGIDAATPVLTPFDGETKGDKFGPSRNLFFGLAAMAGIVAGVTLEHFWGLISRLV